MNPNKVSVILATFNGSRYIQKQIDSIVNQTVLPDEIIICDDASTDDTVFVLNNYLKHSRIKLFINESQLGVVGNFKKAAKLAKSGNWLLFADQDDIWLPQKVSRLIEEMTTLNDDITPALIYTDLKIINKNDEVISESFWGKLKIKPNKINFARLLFGNMVTGCTVIINCPMAREFLLMDAENVLHDEWLALIGHSFGKVKFLNEKLVLYRQHDQNVTFNHNKRVFGIAEQIRNDLFDKNFLRNQFQLAKQFLTKYRYKLAENHLRDIEKFIKLENKVYLIKRITMALTYKKHKKIYYK